MPPPIRLHLCSTRPISSTPNSQNNIQFPTCKVTLLWSPSYQLQRKSFSCVSPRPRTSSTSKTSSIPHNSHASPTSRASLAFYSSLTSPNSQTYRRALPRSQDPPPNPLDPITTHRLQAIERARLVRRSKFAAAGLIGCLVALTALLITVDLPTTPERNDSPNDSPTKGYGDGKGYTEADLRGKGYGVISLAGKAGDGSVELVPTGTTTVPYLPHAISLPEANSERRGISAALPAGVGDVENRYELIGLGIRTVSFLNIQVYVVGLYVAKSDLNIMQARLVKAGAGTEGASALVAGEKEGLRDLLLDGEGSMRVWNDVLRGKPGIKSVVMVVPTRNTDFAHLRDGWVRGITARSKGREYEDEGFGAAVNQFKGVFGRGKIARGKGMLLEMGPKGELGVWVEEEGKASEVEWKKLGEVEDERVGRLVWLGYLGGQNVSSEGARRSVVEGVMELVERPVGTVETRVV